MSFFFHEQRHRSVLGMQTLQQISVYICGAGALGANIAETLARSGVTHLTVIDSDRVEARNLSTQPYDRDDVGSKKVMVLATLLFQSVGIEMTAVTQRLSADNATKLLKSAQLVIDTFDNSSSRQWVKDTCTDLQIPCLHAGLADQYAEIFWNTDYRVPSAAQDDICDYPLARTLVMLTVAITAEIALRFIITGLTENRMITFQDFQVLPCSE